jgi:hypothetical protein
MRFCSPEIHRSLKTADGIAILPNRPVLPFACPYYAAHNQIITHVLVIDGLVQHPEFFAINCVQANVVVSDTVELEESFPVIGRYLIVTAKALFNGLRWVFAIKVQCFANQEKRPG